MESRSASRAATCTMRSVGSSAAAARNASASCSSSASDTGNPMIRCWCPRAVSTSTKRLDCIGVIADEDPGGFLAGVRAESCGGESSPSGSRSGRPRWTGSHVAGCVVPQAWSAHRGSADRRSHRRAGRRVPRSGRPREGGRRGYARHGCCCWSVRSRSSREPVLAVLERIGGQVELSRVRPAARAAKSGRWPKTYASATASVICRWSAVFRRSDAIARGAVAGSGHARRAAAVSTGRGPISSSTLQFRSARVRTLLANSTGWRA